jgi:hypothetical protein
LAGLLASSTLHAATPGDWTAFGGVPFGCNGTIFDVEVADDGLVYVGGSFTTCGEAQANNVAVFDPATQLFSPLGNGAQNGTDLLVNEIESEGGQVYVAGNFFLAGGQVVNRIARWDGSQWHALGAGLGAGGGAKALEVDGTDVYVGGNWTGAGATDARSIARWDGAQWNSLGSGQENGVDGTVESILVKDGNVFIGGSFSEAGTVAANNIARWDGSAWAPVGTGADNGVNGTVRGLIEYNNDLYVGGAFFQAGSEIAENLAVWDGSAWLGRSIIGSISGDFFAFEVFTGELIVGGNFSSAGLPNEAFVTANGVARWNGAAWSSVGVGAENGVDGTPYAVAAGGGQLFVGGRLSNAGTAPASKIAAWNGSEWASVGSASGLGVNGEIQAIARDDGQTYVGGQFTRVGNVEANSIARWDGTGWHALGTGPDNGIGPSFGDVRAILVDGDDVYVGGAFSRAGGQPAENLARWDGAQWHALLDGSENGVVQPVEALAITPDGLYVGGFITQAGAVDVNHIAKWDGTSWSRLGTQAENGTDAPVTTMATDGTDLYVGGSFENAGPQPVTSIARWDGSSWQALGSGLVSDFGNPIVTALNYRGGVLHVGGGFDQAGSVPATGVALWNGAEWGSLGGPASEAIPFVSALAVEDSGAIYAAGPFTGTPGNAIARWTDSGGWSALGTGPQNGIQGRVDAVALGGDRVTIVGDFALAGGNLSSNIAQFQPTPQPLIAVTPTAIDFGSIELGVTSSTEEIEVQNQGEADLEIQALSFLGPHASDFSAASDECSTQPIPPMASCAILLDFSPSGIGGRSASLELASNSPGDPPEITLTGSGEASNSPVIAIDPPTADFGMQPVGGTRIIVSTVENVGGAVLEIGQLSIAGPQSGDFSFLRDACSLQNLQPGDTCFYRVEAAPSDTGDRQADVSIPSNAISSPDSQLMTVIGILGPVIAFDPSEFDFGEVGVGETSTSTSLAIENVGSADLQIDELQLQGADIADFDLTQDDCTGSTVPVGGSCSFQLAFNPKSAGSKTLAVAVISNVGFTRFFFAVGDGVLGNPELDLMPNSIDFGNIPTGDASSTNTLSLSNPGVGPLEVTGIGPADGPFVRVGGSCGAEPFSVPAGGSCTIDYQFQPVDPGSFSQVVAVESDAIAGSDTEFTLAGTSGQFDVAVMKTNAAEFVLSGVATVYDIQVLNLGLSDLFGVEVVDTLPPELDVAAATWTCTPGTGVTCPVGSGSGDIDELVDLPAGAGMTFTLTAPVLAPEGVDVVNTVTATLPSGVDDENPSNNSATDSDPVAVFAADFEFAGCGADLIESRFCVVGENVVLDAVTGLEWRRCSEGRTWDEPTQTCVGDPAGFDWAAASSLAPSGGWRLPTVEELATLRYCSDGDPALFLPSVSGPGIRCSNPGSVVQPVIEPNAFPDMPLNAPAGPPWFWTSTDGDDTIDDSSLAVSFGEGNILNVTVGTSLRVLLVR